MKRSFKPLIIVTSSLLLLFTIILLVLQGVRLKYEELQREIDQLESKIKTEKATMIKLVANYQMLTTEDIIKDYASKELALVDADSEVDRKIILLKEEVNNIKKVISQDNE